MKLLALMLLRHAGEEEDASPQRVELRAAVLRMMALLREAMGGGVAQELAAVLKTLNDNRGQIQKGIIAWIHLIEVLVQEAERAHRHGGGARKKAQVKAAAFRILTSQKARLPGIPDYLYPLVMDFVVEWMTEAIVQAENEYALWESRPEENVWSPVADFVNWIKQALARIWQPIVGCLITAYTTFKYREPLSPELEKAVEGVEPAGILANKNSALRSGVDFLIFVGNHAQQMIAGVKLIFEAVHMAETFLELDGPGKKQYAHDLIIATLEDLGFPVGSGLMGIIVSAFIDAGIEAAWSIFTKRAPETFKHRRKLNAPVGPVPAMSGS
jgi:hypothetical protein